MLEPKDKKYREKYKKQKPPTWRRGAISKQRIAFDKQKGIKVACLKCDKVFTGRINVRICDACKNKEEYNIGSTYARLEHGVAV